MQPVRIKCIIFLQCKLLSNYAYFMFHVIIDKHLVEYSKTLKKNDYLIKSWLERGKHHYANILIRVIKLHMIIWIMVKIMINMGAAL